MTGHERKSVLVVDDEQDIVTIIKFALEKKGFTVTGFTDPVLALQHFDQHPVDYGIVLLDIRMPHLSGFELARKINAANLQVKVLLMTAFEINKSEFKKVLPSTKIDDFIKKPVSMQVLTYMMEKQICDFSES